MKYARKILYTSVFFTTLFGAVRIFAEEGNGGINFVPLAPLQDITTGPDISLVTYLQQMFTFAVGLASVLAVVMIVIGGIQYMTSEVVTDKSDAVKKIQGAVLGLLLAISSVLILKTINPDLLNLDVIKDGVTVDGGTLIEYTNYCFKTAATERHFKLGTETEFCNYAGFSECMAERRRYLANFTTECVPIGEFRNIYGFWWNHRDNPDIIDRFDIVGKDKCEAEHERKSGDSDLEVMSLCVRTEVDR